MKKTIIALMALAGIASGEAATTITAEFSDLPRWAKNFHSDDYSLTFTLSGDFTLENSGTVLAAYWGTEAMTSTWGANGIVLSNGTNGALTLTVGRGKLTGLDGTGWEDYAVTTSTSFTFAGDKAANGNPSSAVFTDAIQLGVTYTLSVTGGEHAMTPTLSWSGGEIKGVTFTGNMAGNPPEGKNIIASVNPGKVIPEPTTATLSLLALAGLAARRRRK